jgi:transcriptional regulator with XRE-family HTH domain
MQPVLTKDQAKRNFAANLAQALLDRDMKPVRLAEAIMVKGETIEAASMRVSRYLRQIHMADGADLANIAEALDVTVDWLLSTPRKKSRHAG